MFRYRRRASRCIGWNCLSQPVVVALAIMLLCAVNYWLLRAIMKSWTGVDRQGAPVKVLLVTYFRGGSSMLGEVFNNRPDTFYWFEPLKPISVKFREEIPDSQQFSTEDAFMLTEEGHVEPFPPSYVRQQAKTLANIFNCRLYKLDKSFLRRKLATSFEKSKNFAPFMNCVDIHRAPLKRKSREDYPDTIIDFCLYDLTRQCLKSTVRVVKAVRVGMYAVPELLTIDPDVRIVHYTRDPRGMLVSMTTLWNRDYDPEWEDGWSRRTCHRMLSDLQVLSTMPSYTALRLRYEDLASRPEYFLRSLYGFLNLTEPSQVTMWRSTHINGMIQGAAMDTVRKNSTATAFNWRNVLPKLSAEIVSNNCQETLRMYRYQIDKNT